MLGKPHIANEFAPSRPGLTRSRSGFTLIELLLSVVLLDVGLVALVGLGTVIIRDGRSTRALSQAARLASVRLERLASVSCTGSASGSANPSPGIAEWFTDIGAPNETRELTDSVIVVSSRGVSNVVLRTRAGC